MKLKLPTVRCRKAASMLALVMRGWVLKLYIFLKRKGLLPVLINNIHQLYPGNLCVIRHECQDCILRIALAIISKTIKLTHY